MQKKFIMVGVAVAAFAALVVAPVASASPVLTGGGKALAVGSSVKRVNEGVLKLTASGFNLECPSVVLTGTVTKNNGTKIEAEIPAGSASFKGTGAGGDCTSNLGSTKWTVTSKLCLATNTGTDTVLVTGCGANVKFDLEVTGTGNCEYSTASVSGAFATNVDAKVIINEQAVSKVAGGIFCPTTGQLDMTLDLSATDGTTLTFS